MTEAISANRCTQAGCSNPGIYSTADGQGVLHHFCTEHLWQKASVTHDGHTCDMLGANPPSNDRCGRPAAAKWVNVIDGRTLYWCELCRRKNYPTKTESAKDERLELQSTKNWELMDTFVFTPIGWVIRLGLLVLAVYGVIWFIHWCWRNS
jgi:hypothetical protein